MTSTEAQPENDSVTRLSCVLNKITGSRLSFSEMEGPRSELAGIASGFNGASAAAAEKLINALPAIKDYGSRWIAARMLRDIALKDEAQGQVSLTALCGAVSREKDGGLRYMLCDLLRDVGLKHENLAVSAAMAISETLGREKDSPALLSQKSALVKLALKYEDAAPIAIAGLSIALENNTDPYKRIVLSGNLRDIGLAWPALATSALYAIAADIKENTDHKVTQQIARHMTDIALNAPELLPQVVAIASLGVLRESKPEGIFAWANTLNKLGQADPMLLIVTQKEALSNPAVMSHADKRRAYIMNLSALADKGKTESGICSGALLKVLKEEPDAHHRRMIIGGLMTCVRNRINPKAIRQGLKDQLRKERDRETKDILEQGLRSLGYIAPVPNLVPVMKPATP